MKLYRNNNGIIAKENWNYEGIIMNLQRIMSLYWKNNGILKKQ